MVEALDGAQLLAICILTLLAGLAAWHLMQVRQNAAVAPPALERPAPRILHLISVADAFDPERAVLWETQIPALQLIRKGVPAARLFLFYARYPQNYPELFENTTFEEWLQFLKRSNLVTVSQGEIRLTTEGEEFLHSLRPAAALSQAGASPASGSCSPRGGR